MVDKLRLLSSSHSTYLCCLNRKTVYALTMTSHSGIAIFLLRIWVHFRISFISPSYCFIWGEKIRTSTYLYTTNVDHLQFRRRLTWNIPKINDHRFLFYFIIARQIFEFLSVECLYHFGSRMCDDRIFLSVWTYFSVCVDFFCVCTEQLQPKHSFYVECMLFGYKVFLWHEGKTEDCIWS